MSLPALVKQWTSYFNNPKGVGTMTQRKKPNKQQRLEKRKEKADLYNEAFMHGYVVGVVEGHKQALEGKLQTKEVMRLK